MRVNTFTPVRRVSTKIDVRNGIQAPVRGVCRMAWDLFDIAEGPIACKHMEELSEKTGMNPENLRIELRRWKRFHAVEAVAA